eukprot:CAMPEP_0114491864 /NCGR_PEP_ID=MMETSP0109-20121206/3238_1 /TAXON_ID=29199 /ORGANISM="Chlorarachnion reptans, Strain CCCM449" /LENGTH=114 /DNA_ID=CAMNT_0001668647 /DNA_START=454 /DNA_END=797 /DNA_ORIENTATION=-
MSRKPLELAQVALHPKVIGGFPRIYRGEQVEQRQPVVARERLDLPVVVDVALQRGEKQLHHLLRVLFGYPPQLPRPVVSVAAFRDRPKVPLHLRPPHESTEPSPRVEAVAAGRW